MSKQIVVDLSALIKDFNGEPYFGDRPNATLAYTLNRFILQAENKSENLVKMVLWAGDLREKQQLSLDTADYALLLDTVKNSPVPLGIKAPIYMAITEAKEAAGKLE